jgi:PKD repeat protein
MTKLLILRPSSAGNFILALLLTVFSARYSSAACNASFTYTVNQAQGKAYLTSTSTGNNLACHWWVNGTFLSGPTVSWAYPGQGYFPVRLTVFDTLDTTCYSTRYDTLFIPAASPCNANFTYAINYSQGKVYFNAPPTANTLLYTWIINGNQYHMPNVAWTYPGPGSYSVSLLVSAPDSSCIDYKSTSIIINGQGCNANFSFYTDSFPGGSQFWFIPQYTDTFASHFWSFGDGDSSFYPSPNHQFPGPGIYRVCHTVSNFFDSCYAMMCDSIVVTDSIGCNVNAQFYFYKDSTNKYHFVPQYPSAAGSLYYWNFGDGQTSNQVFPVHQYNSGGWYHLVCLTVLNPHDSMCADHYCDTVPYTPDSLCQADAGFTYQLQQVDSLGDYKIYHFTPDYLNTAAYNYYWQFEPVNASTQPTPSYLFNTVTATRWVCLTVTSKTNPACKDRHCDTLIIDSGCDANARFTYTRYSNVATAYQFYGQGGNQYVHLWTFGTGQIYTGASPVYTFPAPGVYQVCHMVRKTNDSTCFEQFCDSILIAPVICNAQFYDSSFAQGTEITLWPVSSDTMALYIWSFGDGDSAIGYYQSHTYAMPGTYNICLIVYSAFGSCKWCQQTTVQSSTGLNPSEAAAQSIISLYPNPVIDRLLVEISSRNTETIQIRVISITGQLELEQTALISAGGSKLEIDTRLLQQGMHFLELRTKETAVRSRFMK